MNIVICKTKGKFKLKSAFLHFSRLVLWSFFLMDYDRRKAGEETQRLGRMVWMVEWKRVERANEAYALMAGSCSFEFLSRQTQRSEKKGRRREEESGTIDLGD